MQRVQMWDEEVDLLQLSGLSMSDNESAAGLTSSPTSSMCTSPSMVPESRSPSKRTRRHTVSCLPRRCSESSTRSSSHPSPCSSSTRSVASPFASSTAGCFSETSTVVETPVQRRGEDEGGFKTVNQYTHLECVGKGSFAKVKMVIDNDTEEMRAMKIMRKSTLHRKGAMENVRREVALLKKMNHTNIVKLHEVIDDLQADKLFLVFEYLEKGELVPLLDDGTTGGVTFNTERTRKAMVDIIDGVSFLHDHLIFHRDIKPANLLLDKDGNVKVTDLGVAICFDTENEAANMSCFEGTPAFLPPEVARGNSSVDARAVDLWAMGVTMYVMLHGSLPFYGKSIRDINKAIIHNEVQISPDLCDATADLLERLLEKDPAARISMAELKEHPFFMGDEDISFESCIGKVTVSEEDIANSLTKRKWTRLSLMLAQVRSQLKTVDSIAHRDIAPTEEPRACIRRWQRASLMLVRIRSTLKTMHRQARSRAFCEKVERLAAKEVEVEASFRSQASSCRRYGQSPFASPYASPYSSPSSKPLSPMSVPAVPAPVLA